ncbi:MAG: ABC transporter ATP-binding protein [Peptoniphilus lacrimalis]|uniref:ABC transporter ATP-binding protein n=1 Tax=Peptoniphilus lacrimalis TaxID=33031 RepID=UPI00254DA16A|nr:ABC transporter ATP-binding protein [Peptoniphilus lacrimalis]MDK8282546.1 ABC transporter ATP-binding protein [Peptoniphilus lacrimalis]HEO0351118.1 ABC transporter ATP-binding protein [Streptococcus agalactiae]
MIEIKDVSYRYKESSNYSLKRINCKIKKGECVLVTGSSGSGKSTFTRLINGLIPKEYIGSFSGQIKIDGINLEMLEMWEIASKVGSVFQNPRNQFFSLDTTGEIVFGMENLAFSSIEMKKNFDETIKDLRVEYLLDKDIFNLSGGEKQLIAIASIYALKPEIYIMDEPSANLDKMNILKLRNIIKILKSMGKTIVVAEHRIYYLMDLIDRMIYMDKGKIDKEFSKEELVQMKGGELKKLGIRSFYPVEIEPSFKEFSEKGENILEVKNLQLPYGRNKNTVSFTLKENEIMGLIGSIGCGKTSLGRTLSGLIKEKSGQVYYYGKLLSMKERSRKIYMVMQDPDYQLFMESIQEELELANLEHYKKKELSKISDVLEELDLLEYKDKHPMALSGGQKQRVSVGVSLMMNSQIIIFDEPTSGLDYRNMLRVSKLIKELSDRGKAIIVISHDNEFINNTCTKVFRLD